MTQTKPISIAEPMELASEAQHFVLTFVNDHQTIFRIEENDEPVVFDTPIDAFWKELDEMPNESGDIRLTDKHVIEIYVIRICGKKCKVALFLPAGGQGKIEFIVVTWKNT